MPIRDIDPARYHVTLLDWQTGQPWIDPKTGLTSRDIPYEAGSWTDQMYEPKGPNFSSCQVTFVSLLIRPELRGVLDRLWDTVNGSGNPGNPLPHRVEIYADQPDCGEPVFGGFISTAGVTEKGGTVTIDSLDGLSRGQWQTLDKIEEFSTNADGLYRRAMAGWSNIVNEDFSNPAGVATSYATSHMVLAAGSASAGLAFAACTLSAPTLTIAVGDVYVCEADVSLTYVPQNHGDGPSVKSSRASLYLGLQAASGSDAILFEMGAWSSDQAADPGNVAEFKSTAVTLGGQTFTSGAQSTATLTAHADYSVLTIPIRGSVQFLIRVTSAQTISVAALLDQRWLLLPTGYGPAPTFLGNGWHPYIELRVANAAFDVAQVTSWRVRKLVPYINRASRFVPQSNDPVYYPPNPEACYALLQFTTQKDGAEYRVIPRHYPALDELELDQVGTLGKNASALLGYGQPAGAFAPNSPQTSPATAVADYGSFGIAPPFRFEEGHNLADHPTVSTKALAFANEVVFTGSNQQDAQIISGLHSVADQGNPVQGVVPVRPPIEILSNDDRVGIYNVAQTFAQNELAQRMDATPSLTLSVVGEREFAHQWRAGDTVRVKTRSLVRNLDQDMRIMSVRHTFGSPTREVVVGRTATDVGSLRRLSEATVTSWLYERSGSDAFTYVYPNVGTIAASATSPALTLTLDQFTSGSAINAAYVTWTTDGSNGVDVMSVVPVIDGARVPLTTTERSPTASGSVDVTGHFGFGSHTLAFTNTAGMATGLVSAFVALRLKI